MILKSTEAKKEKCCCYMINIPACDVRLQLKKPSSSLINVTPPLLWCLLIWHYGERCELLKYWTVRHKCRKDTALSCFTETLCSIKQCLVFFFVSSLMIDCVCTRMCDRSTTLETACDYASIIAYSKQGICHPAVPKQHILGHETGPYTLFWWQLFAHFKISCHAESLQLSVLCIVLWKDL